MSTYRKSIGVYDFQEDLLCPAVGHTSNMRELTQEISPSLFDAPPPASYLQAKDFVRWCCSFGADFRNSPDVTNLRFWAKKANVTIHKSEEEEVLSTARSLFLRRVEQSVRKFERAEQTVPAN